MCGTCQIFRPLLKRKNLETELIMSQKLKRPNIIRVDESNLEYKGHGKYIAEEYWFQGKPFTGFVVLARHKNNFVKLEQEYVDGQTLGWEVEYYENGKIEYESLELGATSVLYREYDISGVLLDEGWVAPKYFYNLVAKETGMPVIEKYGFRDSND